jgi:uncharacterized protein YjbI with pentapeptide repeats
MREFFVTKKNILGKTFADRTIQNESFDEAFGNYVSFENVKLINCSFKKSELHSTKWIDTTFEQNTDFKYCNLEGSVFENVTFEGNVDFSGSKLSGATFRDCRFIKSDVHKEESQEKDGINFSSCNLRDSVFENCTFQNSDLRGTEFHKSSILNTDFSASITWRTDFYESEIRKTSFDSSVVNESSFLHAEISRTSFRNATFTNMNLEYSVIERADFTGADTRTGRFLRHIENLQNDPAEPLLRNFPMNEICRTYKCQITNSVFDESHLELFNLTTLDGCSLRGTFLPWSCHWKTIDLPVRITNSRIDNAIPPPLPDYFWRGSFHGSLIENCHWNNHDFAGCITEGARFLKCDFENSCFTYSEFLNSFFENCNFQNAQFARGDKLRSRFEYLMEQNERESARRHERESHIRFPVKNPTDWATILTGSQLVNCNFDQSNFDLVSFDDVVPLTQRGVTMWATKRF